MGRPRRWASDAERMAAKRRAAVNERAEAALDPVVNEHEGQAIEAPEINEHPADGLVQFNDQPHVPHDGPLWIGAGRGTSREYKGEHYVLVSRSVREAGEDDRHGVVTAADWNARLSQTCWHGLKGWACHVC